MSNYRLGQDDPPHTSDEGSGPWCSMGQFHQECLAREYNIQGVIEKEVRWDD